MLLFVALSSYMPLRIAINGSVHPGHLAAGYAGLVMVAAAATAIGVFTSSLTPHQLLAALVGGLLIGLLIIMWWIASKADPPFADVLSYLALYQKHFESMTKGMLHSRDLVYFASVTFLSLLGARIVLGARRWR